MKKLAGMRNYGISAIKLNGSGTGVAEVFLHRYQRDVGRGAISLQHGKPVEYAELADRIARGDKVFVVHMSASAGAFETSDAVRLDQGLQSYRDDGMATPALAELPKYD